MKRAEWQTLKAERKPEISAKTGVNESSGLIFIYQFNGASNHFKSISSQNSTNNGNYSLR